MIKGSIHQEYITIVNIYVLQNQSTLTYKANTGRSEGRNRQQYNNSRELQYLTFNNGHTDHSDRKSIRKCWT